MFGKARWSAARRSGHTEQQAKLILGLLESKRDITLSETETALAERGVLVSGGDPAALRPPKDYAQ